MIEFTLLITAVLFGGMVLFSFGFAAFLFSALPADTARALIRKAFPHFYLFVIGSAAVALLGSVLADGENTLAASLMAIVVATTVYARQILMPAINAATDVGDKSRFNRLHGFSVSITLAHIGMAAWALILLAA
ncbi:DUF4149 domain-containing protein [Phaeobacter sp.]|uniref:DUF4149 domain-containing protein n=1 Tax=Phaeobacter sp. TaxID=1902409 RepID=UPI0025F75856|nr:DUF4149 domain-containing protein [Phaeobacter sp.]